MRSCLNSASRIGRDGSPPLIERDKPGSYRLRPGAELPPPAPRPAPSAPAPARDGSSSRAVHPTTRPAKEHVEDAHGDVPRGPHAYHVVAAVFDAESGRRVEDATIDARVGPLRLGSVTRRLEPMAIAGALTYGNIFTLRVDGPYQIAFIVTVPHRAEPVVVEFSYEHPTS